MSIDVFTAACGSGPACWQHVAASVLIALDVFTNEVGVVRALGERPLPNQAARPSNYSHALHTYHLDTASLSPRVRLSPRLGVLRALKGVLINGPASRLPFTLSMT